jgi:nitrite reductase/ring-hydroxylating ferredoxin subunit
MSYQYVLDINSLPENTPVKVEVAGTAMILIRTLTQVRAFQSKCPHAGAPWKKGLSVKGAWFAHGTKLNSTLKMDNGLSRLR